MIGESQEAYVTATAQNQVRDYGLPTLENDERYEEKGATLFPKIIGKQKMENQDMK